MSAGSREKRAPTKQVGRKTARKLWKSLLTVGNETPIEVCDFLAIRWIDRPFLSSFPRSRSRLLTSRTQSDTLI